ncbi:MAG: hypothetical protein KKD44_05360 [Proteobacteria bacterium]|nr:hypothetical protein [Pseudomonadota bacterium]
MTLLDDSAHRSLWKNKAMAFLVRSRQELWGKHNEDIIAWFFLEGFTHRFIHHMLLGWNRVSRIRPASNWGIPDRAGDNNVRQGKLILPPGIVIPYIVNKDLRKLLIYNHLSDNPTRNVTLPGSSSESIILGEQRTRVAVISNIIHGLLLHQEFQDRITIIIPHNPFEKPDKDIYDFIRDAKHCWICQEPLTGRRDEALSPWLGIAQPTDLIAYSRAIDVINTIKPYLMSQEESP